MTHHLKVGNRVNVSFDEGNHHAEGVISLCDVGPGGHSWSDKAFLYMNGPDAIGQDNVTPKTQMVFVKYPSGKYMGGRPWEWENIKHMTLVDWRPMTAATVEFHVNGELVDSIYLDHDEMVQELEGLIDEARDSTKGNKAEVAVYIAWHEHDFCENPEECVNGFSLEHIFAGGREKEKLDLDPTWMPQDNGVLIDGHHRTNALQRMRNQDIRECAAATGRDEEYITWEEAAAWKKERQDDARLKLEQIQWRQPVER
jgi:hypothetical protein